MESKMKRKIIVAAMAAGFAFYNVASLAEDQTNEDDVTSETEDVQDPQIMELVEVKASSGYRVTTASSVTGLNVALKDLPVNVQVMTSQVLADFQLQSQRDALQFSAMVDDKRIRGFNSGEFFRNGFIYLSDTPGYTINRMEILLGPSAVLNGPVTPGGAVNIITKQPVMDENFGDFNGYWGFSDGRNNAGINMDVNAPLGSQVSFRLVAGLQNEGGYGTAVDNKNYAILPMIEWRPTDTTIINFEYNKYEINTDRVDRPMGIELYLPGATPGEEVPLAKAYGIGPRDSWFGQDTDIEESVDDYTIGLKQQLGEQFIFQAAYNSHNRDFVFGPGNRPRIDIFYRMILNDGAPDGSSDPNDYMLRRLTEQLSLLNDVDQVNTSLTWIPEWGGSSSHQFNLGASFYDQDAHLTIARPREVSATGGFYFDWFDPNDWAENNLQFNQAGADLNFITVLDRTETVDLTNVFLNWNGSFIDGRLNVLLGLVDSDIKIARTNLRDASPEKVTIADNQEWLIQAGAVFAFNDTVSIYGNYSESQLPDVNDPDFNTAPPVRLGEQMEVGLRFSFLENTLAASVAYYMIDEELKGETTRKANADGFEVTASWLPTDNLDVSFSYAYTDTEVTASSITSSIGDPLVDEVPNKAALWGRYQFDGAAQGLAVGAGYVYTGSRVRPTAAAAQSVKKLDGKVLRYNPESRLDLFATYDWQSWQFSLNLRNLTKEGNLSNTVPRVPLQGGVKANGKPYVFDGEMEVMLGARFRY
jgi:outer membrane receptor protein involved in Fe transport